MTAFQKLSLVGIAIAAALLAGCDAPAHPEVNEENCRPENIANLEKDAQQEFSSQCLRRNSFQPSEQKTW